MKLWQIEYSKVLGGFYQSRVVAMAENLEAAVDKACAAFRTHLIGFADTVGFVNDASGEMVDVDEPEFASALESRIAAFRQELLENMVEVPEGSIIAHHSG